MICGGHISYADGKNVDQCKEWCIADDTCHAIGIRKSSGRCYKRDTKASCREDQRFTSYLLTREGISQNFNEIIV